MNTITLETGDVYLFKEGEYIEQHYSEPIAGNLIEQKFFFSYDYINLE